MDDFDYDMYEDDEDLSSEYYDNPRSANLWYKPEDEEPAITALELWNLCLVPSISTGLVHSSTLLLWCLLFRITTQFIPVASLFCHAVSAACGLLLLHWFFNTVAYYIIAFGAISYLVLFFVSRFVSKWRGAVTSLVCVAILLISEMLLGHENAWHKIRGAQMLVAMKVISVAFDVDIGAFQSLPTTVEFAGYVFCVGTCVFGPWVSYRDYIAIYKNPVWNFQWALQMLLSFGLSIIFLSMSTCWIHWLIADNSWKWLLAYRAALSFRMSQYFISFLSQATAMMSGHGHHDDLGWHIPVTKPQNIEIPRSLVQVVVSWNIPMHHFLKNYVFRTTKPLGSFVAIVATYLISSLLHGLNFQLAAVLLSLGIYTYIEHVVRQKLSSVFNACIAARPCKKECSHNFKEKNILVMFANIGFGLIACFHLTYLGVMFDDTDLQDEGYSYSHVFNKWSSLNFASHWFALLTYLFYLLI